MVEGVISPLVYKIREAFLLKENLGTKESVFAHKFALEEVFQRERENKNLIGVYIEGGKHRGRPCLKLGIRTIHVYQKGGGASQGGGTAAAMRFLDGYSKSKNSTEGLSRGGQGDLLPCLEGGRYAKGECV